MKIRYKYIVTEPEEPPCLECRHLDVCTALERCWSFDVYVETGRAILPPQMRKERETRLA